MDYLSFSFLLILSLALLGVLTSACTDICQSQSWTRSVTAHHLPPRHMLASSSRLPSHWRALDLLAW